MVTASDAVVTWLDQHVKNRVLRERYQQRWNQWRHRLPDADVVAAWIVRSAEHPELHAWILDLFAHKTLPAYMTIIAYSPFLAQRVLAHPEFFRDLFQSPDVFQTRSREVWFEQLERFLMLHSTLDLASGLALFRDRGWSRILAADILGEMALPEVTEQLSFLADVIVAKAFAATEPRSVDFPSRVARSQSPFESRLAVFALGKWGGLELNYSSDLDLFILIDLHPGGEPSDTSAVLQHFGEWVVRALDQLRTYTPYGRAYRVDLRLRPLGHEGEMVVTRAQAQRYYQRWADLWEKQALIKLRFVYGDRELAERFQQDVHAILVPPPRVADLIERLRHLRSERLNQLGDRAAIHVKEGPGGLRDIEFLVQLLQWLNWERHPIVRQPNTLKALRVLLDLDEVTPRMYRLLFNAYVFLRRCEHLLQIEENRQVFELPGGREERFRFARKMGYRGSDPWKRFETDYLLTTRRVSEIWEHLLSRLAAPSKSHPEQALRPESEIGRHRWEELLREEPALTVFADRPVWRPWLTRILESPLYPEIRHHLLWTVKRLQEFPELDRLLNERPGWHTIIQNMLVASPARAEAFWRYGHLLTDSVVQGLFHPDTDWGLWLTRGIQDNAAWPLTKRVRAMELVLGMLEFSDQLTLERVWALHTLKTESILRISASESLHRVLESALGEVPMWAERHIPVWLIALGRLGTGEMDWGSDADLMILYDNAAFRRLGIPDPGPMLQRWASTWIRTLSRWTTWGYLVEADLRLRPFGRSGDLVQNAARVLDYFSSRAEPWEMLSFLKARLIMGNTATFAEWMHELRHTWIRRGWDRRTIMNEMVKMIQNWRSEYPRSHLKFGAGGWMEWWFRVHLYQFERGWLNQTFWQDQRSSFWWLMEMHREGWLGDEEHRFLEHLFRLVHWWRLMGYRDANWRPERVRRLQQRLEVLNHPDRTWLEHWPEAAERLHRGLMERLQAQ